MARKYKATKSECVVFNGISFRRYPNAKQWSHRMYYTPHSGHRRNGIGALHQEIWKSVHGDIPAGFQIHHIDENPLNNTIDNLECISKEEHDKRHSAQRSERAKRPEALKQLASINQLAVEWHRSEEGRQWHSDHGKKAWENRKPVTLVCVLCGDDFQTFRPEVARYCSDFCYIRRNGKKQKQKVICKHCGKEKETHYPKAVNFCSPLCRQRSYAADGRYAERIGKRKQ